MTQLSPRQFASAQVGDRAMARPQLPLPGAPGAECPPVFLHGDAGQGETPFITLPSLPGARTRSRTAPLDPLGADAATAPFCDSGAVAANLSVQLVLSKRREQLARGYTVANDLRGPIGLLAGEAQRYLVDARDWLARPNHDPERKHFELKLVNAGALIVAELDRLHASRSQQSPDA